jgi:hypothetical protein
MTLPIPPLGALPPDAVVDVLLNGEAQGSILRRQGGSWRTDREQRRDEGPSALGELSVFPIRIAPRRRERMRYVITTFTALSGNSLPKQR